MPIPSHSSASVTVSAGRNELQRVAIPPVREADGLLKLLATGVCGSDVKKFDRDLPARIMGHEIIGEIASLGDVAATRWGVEIGDVVMVEEYLPCGHCSYCRSGEYRMCLQSDGKATVGALRYGTTPLAVQPGLWGGYSEYLYLHPASVMHRIPAGLAPARATLALPLSNGYEWVCRLGECSLGSTVVIFGPGQQGLACISAARAAGAKTVLCVGLESDRERLAIATALGADESLVFSARIAEEILEATAGDPVDLVVDTASGSEAVFSAAAAVIRKQGRVVLAAASPGPVNGFPLEAITRKALTVRGARGHSFAAVEWALEALCESSLPFGLLESREFSLADVGEALRRTVDGSGADSAHAVVLP